MERTDAVQAVAQRYVDSGHFAGIEWHVEQRGETLTNGRAGWANAAAQTPMPEAPIYRIYSMTKPIVSVMALILIEQGKMRLYDTVGSFNPAFGSMRVLHPNGDLVPVLRPITIEDLFTHRAGFTYEFIAGCHIAPYYRSRGISGDGLCTLDEMMDRLAELPLAFQPGTQFRYSVAIDVLVHVVERAAGRPIHELLYEHIFEPLGMKDTAYHVPQEKLDRLMPIYGSRDIVSEPPLVSPAHDLVEMDVSQRYPHDRPETFHRGGHGLFSTLDDYLRFSRFLLDGRAQDGTQIISRKMIEMMRANRIPENQLPLRIGPVTLPGYGLGLGVGVMVGVGQAMSLTGIGQLSGAGAASTSFWVDPVDEMVGVVMTQYLMSMLPMTDDMRVAAYQMLA